MEVLVQDGRNYILSIRMQGFPPGNMKVPDNHQVRISKTSSPVGKRWNKWETLWGGTWKEALKKGKELSEELGIPFHPTIQHGGC